MTIQVIDIAFVEITTQNGTYLQYYKTIVAQKYRSYVYVNPMLFDLMPRFHDIITPICGPSSRWIISSEALGAELEAI